VIPTLTQIIDVTADFFHVDRAELMGRTRLLSVALPRQVVMYLAREMTRLSNEQVGEEIDRDPTTVIHGYRTIERKLLADPELVAQIDMLRRQIHEAATRKAVPA
jgi:chromosomal replication initiator protein